LAEKSPTNYYICLKFFFRSITSRQHLYCLTKFISFKVALSEKHLPVLKDIAKVVDWRMMCSYWS